MTEVAVDKQSCKTSTTIDDEVVNTFSVREVENVMPVAEDFDRLKLKIFTELMSTDETSTE